VDWKTICNAVERLNEEGAGFLYRKRILRHAAAAVFHPGRTGRASSFYKEAA
jgi:hypothetical protein